MRSITRSLAALQVLIAFSAAAMAAEPPVDVARVAAWLASQSETDRTVSLRFREYVPPPPVTISDWDHLKTQSVDAARTPFERMAAFALLHASDTQRDAAIRKFFGETHIRIRSSGAKVVSFSAYVSALQSKATMKTRGMPELAKPPPWFAAFVATDHGLLIRMATLESDPIAMVALGLVGGERAAEALVFAPFLVLGANRTGNANYQGLRLLCRATSSRNWLKSCLANYELSDPRRAMIVMALADARDPDAPALLAGLLQTLTAPAGFKGNPRDRAHDKQHPLLPPRIMTIDVLEICRRWGEPSLGHELAEFIYAGSGDLWWAIIAARACGVTLTKPRLMALSAKPQSFWDTYFVFHVLTPLLKADDGDAIALLLAPTEWHNRGFSSRVLWLEDIAETFQTPSVRDALIAVAQEHPNRPTRERAIRASERIPGPEVTSMLRQTEARGSGEAMRILCEREADASAAFMRRVADPNPRIRETARGLVRAHPGSSDTQLPGELTSEHRTIILKHLLADWPETDASSQCTALAVSTLWRLIRHRPRTERAQWEPELAADVVRCAKQTLATERGHRHQTALLTALNWAHTNEARKVVEELVQAGRNGEVRGSAQKVLQGWGDSRVAPVVDEH